ncbi:MAG: SDR family oxidoreductase [Verrucomicrobiales bacterium]|nr:SDR family oxidoreductase [Verrucomicrobiales bacterium]
MNSPEPFLDFGGRQVVVTGASSGIGRAIAVELARRGASLVLMGRDVGRLEETVRLIAAPGVEVMALDLRENVGWLDRFRDVVSRRGRIYGLCHAAGAVETLPVTAFRAESFRSMMEVNVTAALELSKVICRRDILAEEGGSLLFIASIYGSVGKPGQVSYSATKGALVAAARAMAVELARRKVRVNTLSPGLVHTRLADEALARLDPEQTRLLEASHPLGSGTPEDVARTATFMLAPQTRWLTGVDWALDGGYTAQ